MEAPALKETTPSKRRFSSFPKPKAPATESASQTLSPQLLWTLTATTVLAVGNIYYSQPLLGEIANSFQQSAARTGIIPTLTQIGYVSGLVFLTPLGDVLEKRKLLTALLLFASIALLGAALAPTFAVFLAACLAIGLTSILVQVLIPFVAVLSRPEDRGKNLGTILSGALIGVLISRTLSGFVGAHLGWRGMFFVGSATMLALAVVLRISLPKYESPSKLKYPHLLKSVWTLCRDLPDLRAIAVTGALMYAALSAFWASLAFFLQSDTYHMGPGVAGSFGLVGTVGALAANFAGRYAERIGPRRVVQGCIVVMALAYLVFGLVGGHLAGLIAGVILLDLGAQAATVSNQTQIYQLHASAQTRLNTIYKIFYFAGGAAGSALSAIGWEYFGWVGVCGVGLFFLAAAYTWEQFVRITRNGRAGTVAGR